VTVNFYRGMLDLQRYPLNQNNSYKLFSIKVFMYQVTYRFMLQRQEWNCENLTFLRIEKLQYLCHYYLEKDSKGTPMLKANPHILFFIWFDGHTILYFIWFDGHTILYIIWFDGHTILFDLYKTDIPFYISFDLTDIKRTYHFIFHLFWPI